MTARREVDVDDRPSIAVERAALGRDAIVSIEVAARWLGGRRSEAMAWIEQLGVVFAHPITGASSVRWGRIVDAAEGVADRGPTMRPRDIGTMPRERL